MKTVNRLAVAAVLAWGCLVVGSGGAATSARAAGLALPRAYEGSVTYDAFTYRWTDPKGDAYQGWFEDFALRDFTFHRGTGRGTYTFNGATVQFLRPSILEEKEFVRYGAARNEKYYAICLSKYVEDTGRRPSSSLNVNGRKAVLSVQVPLAVKEGSAPRYEADCPSSLQHVSVGFTLPGTVSTNPAGEIHFVESLDQPATKWSGRVVLSITASLFPRR